MAIRPLLVSPDPRLRRVAEPVRCFDDQLNSAAQDLRDSFAAAADLGLSAPQIGIPLRLILLTDPEDEAQSLLIANPEIVEAQGWMLMTESCASVPGVRGTLSRSATVRVQGQDLDGAPLEFQFEGLAAACAQHELDHLDGRLFVDRLPFWRRWFLRAAAA